MDTVCVVSSLEQFNQITNQDKVTIFDFWAAWCGPCRAISPVFKTLSENHPSIGFYKIDIEANHEVPQKVGITAMPTFIAYRNGKELGKVIGPAPKQLEEFIQKYV